MNTLQDSEHYLDIVFKTLELQDKHFSHIEFEDCEFTDCDFSNSRFDKCVFTNCQFIRCNLSLICLTNSKLFAVSFLESKLVGVDWTKAIWPKYHLDFELQFKQCILNDSSFFGLTLHQLVLEECKLHDVDFREGDFFESTMTYCDFSYSVFMRTNLHHVDFTESTAYAINVLENQVKGAKFSKYEALNLLQCLDIELID